MRFIYFIKNKNRIFDKNDEYIQTFNIKIYKK
jgi:hypothetical protein